MKQLHSENVQNAYKQGIQSFVDYMGATDSKFCLGVPHRNTNNSDLESPKKEKSWIKFLCMHKWSTFTP